MSEKQKSIPAVVLDLLADDDEAFSMPVEIPRRDKDPVTVTFTCRAMGKKAWAKVRDEASEAGNARSKARIEEVKKQGGDAVIHVSDIVEDGMTEDAKIITRFATGWDLAHDLNTENLQRLEDKFGGSMRAIVEAYEIAIYQSRLGNSGRQPARS